MSTTDALSDRPRRWWWTPDNKFDLTGPRYEVEIVAWQERGAIVIPDYPKWDGKPLYVRLSELTSEPA